VQAEGVAFSPFSDSDTREELLTRLREQLAAGGRSVLPGATLFAAGLPTSIQLLEVLEESLGYPVFGVRVPGRYAWVVSREPLGDPESLISELFGAE
jgi:hypothetical protein